MSATVTLFRAHDYPDISPSNTPARTRHRPHRTPRVGRRTVTPAHDGLVGSEMCIRDRYSASCFTCPLPDCRQPANVCLSVNRLALERL